MGISLRDQLLQSGLVKQFREEKQARNEQAGTHGQKKQRGGSQGKPRDQASAAADKGRAGSGKQKAAGARHGGQRKPASDLAQAYAARARAEQEERAAEQRRQEEAARLKRERKQRLDQLVKAHAQNSDDAEHARHFEQRGKIRRVYCTEAQLKAVNCGELAVITHMGRYFLVAASVAEEVAGFWPEALVLQVDPLAAEGGEDYSDPRFQVPDDLVW